MELQQESSKHGTPHAAEPKILSSSSSAFVSASQSPFFSPESSCRLVPEQARSVISTFEGVFAASSTAGHGNLVANSLIFQPEVPANGDLIQSDALPPPSSLCTSTNFGAPAIVYNNPSFVSCFSGPCNGSSSNTQGTSHGHSSRRNRHKFPHPRPSSSTTSSHRLRSYDVYIGFHGRKPLLVRFANWLCTELQVYGISSYVSDRARCRSSRSHSAAERIMNDASYGIVIITEKSFGNPYSIEELRNFTVRKNLIPIFFDVSAADCHARDIVGRRGDLWEKYGGELWMLYGGIEREWWEAVDALARAVDIHLEANDGCWRDCIMKTVVFLAIKLGRRSVVDRVNRWKKRTEKEELPFLRNELFVGRKKEISELELVLFGDVDGEGKMEYFELKTRHRRRGCVYDNADQGSKGKAAVVWKESEKEIEMQRLSGLENGHRLPVAKNAGKYGRKRRPAKILYGKGIACVSGESGIGKTELALEFAYRFAQRYKMVLWIGGESRYIQQNYLSLRNFLEVDISIDSHLHDKGGGGTRCFEEQEEEALMKLRREMMRDTPFLIIIDNLESEKDWWDQRFIMDLLPRLGGQTHIIITTRLPCVMNLEPMKLSYLSGAEAMKLMRGGSIKDYPLMEVDALKVIEERLGRLTLGLAIVGAILSELPITPSRLLETINRVPLRDFSCTDQEVFTLKSHEFLAKLFDVCLSIFDHAEGQQSLATRMVLVSGWFAPSAVQVQLVALAAHKFRKKLLSSPRWKRYLVRALTCRAASSHSSKSGAEAASLLTRFGMARSSIRPNHLQFHELIRSYARRRGVARAAHCVVQAVYLRGSISHSSQHLWAACFLVLGIGTDPVVAELRPSEMLQFIKQMALPLAVHIFLNYSRCGAALELLRLSTDALEHAAESLLSQANKWRRRPAFRCLLAGRSGSGYTYLWQELALLRATLLETRAKLMLRGGLYDTGDDLIRKAIFIRTSISGEHHPDTMLARETLSKLTRLLTNVQLR